MTIQHFSQGTQMILHPNTTDWATVAIGFGKMLEEAGKKIDPVAALQAGLVALKLIQMYRAKESTRGKVFRIVSTLQPGGHPLVDVAYSVGALTNTGATAATVGVLKLAQAALATTEPPLPTKAEIAATIAELAALGMKIVVEKKSDEGVARQPHLTLV